MCCLGNNHVLDWSQPGLLETLDALHGAGIQTAGAGRNAAEAEWPAVVAVPQAQPSGRILVWAVGNESSGVPFTWAATHSRPGVFYVDLSEGDAEHLGSLIAAEKQPGDVAVVSVHWGSNWGFPVPRSQQQFAHVLIDKGELCALLP